MSTNSNSARVSFRLGHILRIDDFIEFAQAIEFYVEF